MSELLHAQEISARPPKPKDIADAFKSFFTSKKGAFEDFHIGLAHNAFRHLLENPKENGEQWFTRQELVALVNELINFRRRPETGGNPHVQFGSALIDQITNMEYAEDANSTTKMTKEKSYDLVIRPKLVRLLALYGATSRAREIATEFYNDYSNVPEAYKKVTRSVWNDVLAGAARENNSDEMAKTTKLFNESSVPLTDVTQFVIVSFFAGRQQLDTAKFWYSQPIVHKETGKETATILSSTYTALLKACALAGDLTFGQEVVGGLTKGKVPDKKGWDAIFLWSAAIGKGVDEVERMMNVMVRRTEEAQATAIYPDVDTINLLVEFAMSKSDPYSAERYIALGEKRGILPNEHTYTMQMQYRLSVKDIDGAKAAYYNLQGDFKGSEASIAAINDLIQVLCESKQHNYDDIMAIVDDLHERKARFAPETIAKLCILHLQRVEIHDAMDLLQVHAHQYSPAQRAVISKSLCAFILDGETSTADAWDAYQILRNTFPETSRDDRIQLMNEFFARNRSDMSCHVFFHMKNHTAESHQANREVYIAAFTGFARCTDAESLELVNNQLKLEFKVEMNTKLRNALMLAHAACGNNKKALEIWREICESKEGPSYNSIAIAFRSCEGMPWGDQHAKSIWARLKEQDVEIDKKIFTAYLSAIARNFLHDEALALVETVEEEHGFTPDFYMYVYTSLAMNIFLLTNAQSW